MGGSFKVNYLFIWRGCYKSYYQYPFVKKLTFDIAEATGMMMKIDTIEPAASCYAFRASG